MLGKLIKHEWKGVCRMGLIMLAVLAFATLFGFFAARSPILWGNVQVQDDFVEAFLVLMWFASILVYILLLVGVIYAMLIYLAVRFYRTMYTDEGYLLHTLPVTKHQILISKILVGVIWELFMYIAMILSIACFIFAAMEANTPGSVGSMLSNLPSFFRELSSLWGRMDPSSRATLTHLFVSMGLMALTALPSMLIMIFGAISLGQLFSKHRVLMSIICYFGILIATSLLSYAARLLSYAGARALNAGEMARYVFAYVDMNVILNLITAVALYCLSHFITSKKLNME